MNVYYVNKRAVGAWCSQCNFLAVITQGWMIPLPVLIRLLETKDIAEQ
jgi:hypothetical protein